MFLLRLLFISAEPGMVVLRDPQKILPLVIYPPLLSKRKTSMVQKCQNRGNSNQQKAE